jgi:hypothetical protein
MRPHTVPRAYVGYQQKRFYRTPRVFGDIMHAVGEAPVETAPDGPSIR